MKNMSKSLKIFTVIALSAIVVGMVFLGIFGFNKTLDYDNGYELKIEIEGNYGETAESTAGKMKTAAEKYFNEKGVNYKNYSVETLENGNVLLIKLDQQSSEKIVIADLTAKIDDAIFESGLTSSASLYKKQIFTSSELGWVILGLGITAVIMFIYVFFTEKLAGALSVIITSLISVLLFLSLMAITRIPATPFVYTVMAFTCLLGASLSLVLVNRLSELKKNVGNDKKTGAELGDVALKSSAVRLAFVSGAILLAGLLFAIIGPAYLRFLGLQIIVSVISSLFATVSFSAVLWRVFKNDKKSKNLPEKEDAVGTLK